MEAEAMRIAEKEKEAYKSIIQLEEFYQMFDNTVKSSTTEIVDEPKNPAITPAQAEVLSKNGSLKLNFNELLQDLRGLILFNVPDSAQKLSAVSKLDLSNNNMRDLPESVTSLMNLRILDIRSNQLKSLPRFMGRLTKLKVLNVSGNSIAELPESIQDCSTLEELIADFNELKRLPESLGFDLVQLRKLSLRSNKLSFLPASVSHMTSLRILDLHMNKLLCLPMDMENLINLEILNASCNFNYLTALPESIGALVSLIELDVSYNQIKALPYSVGCLEELEQLNLEGNPLVMPPPETVNEGVHAVKEYLSNRLNKISERPNLSCLSRSRRWPSSRVVLNGKKEAMTWQEGRSEEDDLAVSSRCFFTSSVSTTPRRSTQYLDSPPNF
ncbi:plant intracellular Ras-group-related LRR protein 7 isoform X2 [Cryptomeria japonica]|nr:plant intracellular Ras-group-related LRR protein 7 isoform X2 [Cryptomeria japonica]